MKKHKKDSMNSWKTRIYDRNMRCGTETLSAGRRIACGLRRHTVSSVGVCLLSAGLLLAGCSKDQTGTPDGALVEILPQVELVTPSAAARIASRAVADPSLNMDFWFARADESSAGAWGQYGAGALSATRTGGSGQQALTFAPKQYYLANGLKSRMTGWYPGGASSEGSGEGCYDAAEATVRWTIDGSQDILLAAPREGSKTQAMSAFAFNHALAQLQLCFYAENQTAAERWGKILSVSVRGQRNAAAFTLATAADDRLALEFSGAADNAFALKNVEPQQAPVGTGENAVAIGAPVMIEPQADPCTLSIEIETEKRGTQIATVSERSYPAGQAVKIMIRVTTEALSIDRAGCAIVPWESPEAFAAADYPYVRDGNMLVLSDEFGAAGGVTYPLHGPWFKTPLHVEGKWHGNDSGYNTLGRRFRVAASDAVDKAGVSPAMSWYEAAGVWSGDANPEAFYDACAAYGEEQDESDKGTWRLPTMRELKLICDRQSELTGVARLSESAYWSATGVSDSDAWNIGLADGSMDNSAKTSLCNARCVRDEQSDVAQQYPYVENGNVLVVSDDYGMADTDLYPTHGPWVRTPLHIAKEWYANTSGYNTLSRKLEVATKNASDHTMTWDYAFTSCLYYSQYEDESDEYTWRLPTVREMKLIYDMQEQLTGVDLSSEDIYWTATGYPDSRATVGWMLPFSTGMPVFDNGSEKTYADVRCVRDVGVEDARTLPYVVNGTTVVVEDGNLLPADEWLDVKHEIWRQTPYHYANEMYDNSGYNTVGRKFEVAAQDVSTSASWNDAVLACASYSQSSGAAGTWRLPTVAELRVIWEQRNSLTNSPFVTERRTYYWSATSTTGEEAFCMVFRSGNGDAFNYKNNARLRVRCVRDVGAETARVYPYVSGKATLVIQDAGGGNSVMYPTHEPWLTTPVHYESAWDANASNQNAVAEKFEVASKPAAAESSTAWADAAQLCKSYTQSGDDAGTWRLPTIRELKLIYDMKARLSGDLNLRYSNHWSATQKDWNGSTAWRLNMANGGIYLSDKTTLYTVRCVRDLQ